MKIACHDARGFSLIELITAMLLASIVGTLGSIAVVSFAKSFLVAKESAQLAGTAQLATLRIAKEFIAIKSVSAASAASISFRSQHGADLEKNFTIAHSGSHLLLTDNGTGTTDILASGVSGFNLVYYDWNYDLANPLVASSSWTNWPNSEFPLSLKIKEASYDADDQELEIKFTDTEHGSSLDFQLTYAGSNSNCDRKGSKFECERDSALCYNTAYLWASSASGGGGTQSYVAVPLEPPCASEAPNPGANNPPPAPTGSGGTKLIKSTLTLAGTPPFSITVAPRNIN